MGKSSKKNDTAVVPFDLPLSHFVSHFVFVAIRKSFLYNTLGVMVRQSVIPHFLNAVAAMVYGVFC